MLSLYTVQIKSEGTKKRKSFWFGLVFFGPFVPTVQDTGNISVTAVFPFADDADSTAGCMRQDRLPILGLLLSSFIQPLMLYSHFYSVFSLLYLIHSSHTWGDGSDTCVGVMLVYLRPHKH